MDKGRNILAGTDTDNESNQAPREGGTFLHVGYNYIAKEFGPGEYQQIVL
jgi:hypothetical protein